MARYPVKLLLAGLLAFAGMAPAQAQNAYPLFEPADGILVGDVDTYVTTAADASDIINLWTACSVTTFLRGDGDCSLIDLTANVTGTLPIGNGGTGVTSLGNLTRVDDSNVTLTLGGTPTGALINNTSLTLGWTGLLPPSRGGLGISTVTDDSVPLANGSAWTNAVIPNCQDTSGNHLNYDTSTNAFLCGTSSSTTPVTPANPTGTVGLTAVNGTSVNFMRSDAAPALSQAIAPTWTGQHIFSHAGSAQAIFNGSTDGASYFTMATTGTPYGYLGSGAAIASSTGGVALGGINRVRLATGASGSSTRVDITDASITTTLPLYGPNGSVGAPAFTFSGDTDTGIYGTSDNRLRMAAGGVQALVVGDTFLAPQVSTLAPDGSAAAPTYSFGNDTDTGFYSAGANIIGMAAGGIAQGEISGLGIGMKDGSATLPSYYFANDPDTGIYRIGSNSLGLSTGGALRLQVQDQILYADGSAASPIASFQNDTNTGIYRYSADGIGFATNGIARVVIDNAGVYVPDGTAALPGVAFLADGDTGFYRAGSDSLGISTGGSNRVTIGPGVQVGAPTGGDQGAGTINATALYVNGVAVGSVAQTTGTFTASWDTACTTTPTMTFDWVKTGNVVVLQIVSTSGFSCTSDDVSIAAPAGTVPAEITPSQTFLGHNLIGNCVDAGTGVMCGLEVYSNGSMQIHAATQTNGHMSWTNSGTKSAAGMAGASITYILNNP